MKIAVIGSGAAGLGTALALSQTHDVRLFEKAERFGGHAHTVEVDYDGATIPVDVGFIVFNEVNYPTLCGMFDHLGVASEASDMSFGVSLDRGRMEYACTDVDSVFAQRWRAFDLRFVGGFRDVMRFNREAPLALTSGALDNVSLGDWLDAGGFGQTFRRTFLLPMGGAIWSTPLDRMEAFPARAFVQFFVNHELMNGFKQVIRWRTVSGGSQSYVRRILERLGPRAQAGVGATQVSRGVDGKVRVRFDDGSEERFDQVVLASHANQALALLDDADAQERALLGAMGVSKNVAVLHRDPSLMPARRKVWSSWNFLAETGAEGRPPAVSYWMNRLQNLDPERPLFVTLNPPHEPDPALTFGRFACDHPLFDQAAFGAQSGMDAIQGRGGVWYAGAWLGWGFHEDAVASGVRVARALGANPSWAPDAQGVAAVAAE